MSWLKWVLLINALNFMVILCVMILAGAPEIAKLFITLLAVNNGVLAVTTPNNNQKQEGGKNAE